MKPRRVILTLEVETEAPLSVLRKRSAYLDMAVGEGEIYCVSVLQAQANVIEPWDDGKVGGTDPE